MFEIYITFDLSMLASLASVGYLQGFAPRSAVNGVAQASRSAAVMQFEPGAGPPGERDMKGDVITGAHQTRALAKHPADRARLRAQATGWHRTMADSPTS